MCSKFEVSKPTPRSLKWCHFSCPLSLKEGCPELRKRWQLFVLWARVVLHTTSWLILMRWIGGMHDFPSTGCVFQPRDMPNESWQDTLFSADSLRAPFPCHPFVTSTLLYLYYCVLVSVTKTDLFISLFTLHLTNPTPSPFLSFPSNSTALPLSQHPQSPP